MSSPVQLVGGLGGAIGSDFRQAQNQLLFVEYNGKLSRLNLYRSGAIVSSGTGTLRGTWTWDFDTGKLVASGPGADVWWEQHTAVVRTMEAQNGARQVNLGVVNFNAITPDTLANLTYTSAPIAGNNDASNQLVAGDVFAVRTTAGNYAKVKIVTYGYDLQIEWVTYQLDSPYAVLGTGYSEPEDVQASSDGAHAYVTERSGDLVKVALTNADRAAATVVASGMTAPQQIFLDESNDAAYVVEYAASGSLWHVELSTGTKTALLSNLENAVGMILTADLQYAYISEQTAGADQGRISRFQLSDGAREPIVTGLTAPFYLQWLDPQQTTLLVPERDPANRITAVNVTARSSNVAAGGLPSRPSSVALTMPGQILVCCDAVIERVDLAPSAFQPAGPLLMGIGFVPFDRVIGGLADTTMDPSYFFQVHKAPFGGTLPLMINHMRAYADGARYYRVKVDTVVHTDQWTDYKWNGFSYIATNNSTGSVPGGAAGFYPVRPISELFLWLNPGLGDLLDSRTLTDGPHTITVEFVDGAGMQIENSTPLPIIVDNSACTATVQTPILHGTTADEHCGLLHYGTKNADLVTMPFTAIRPSGNANFSFSLIKGVNAVALPPAPPTSGPVSAAVSPIEAKVEDLMGECDIAGFAELVYVAATTTNGWGRQSQYDASAAIAFVLAP
jgi:hypothetical protein